MNPRPAAVRHACNVGTSEQSEGACDCSMSTAFKVCRGASRHEAGIVSKSSHSRTRKRRQSGLCPRFRPIGAARNGRLVAARQASGQGGRGDAAWEFRKERSTTRFENLGCQPMPLGLGGRTMNEGDARPDGDQVRFQKNSASDVPPPLRGLAGATP